MWWEEFEKQLTAAFASYDKKEKRQVYSDEMKLRILIKKINADFLGSAKAGVNIELTRPNITMTYEQALQMFRNVVNVKFPPDMGGTKRPRRQINETSRRGGRGGRGGRGRGRARGGRGRGGSKRTRDDSTFITLTDGKQVEYHPSFQFSSEVYAKMKQSDKELMYQQREEYKRQHNSRSSISTTSTIPQAMPVGQQQSANPPTAAQA